MKLKFIYTLFFAAILYMLPASAQDTTGLTLGQKKFEKMMKKHNTVVLDVRTPDEYRSGFIGNAINYDVMDSAAFSNKVVSLDKNKKYLLYCKSGRRSGKALVMMKNMGFTKVFHLRGGVTGWKGDLHKPE